MRRRLFTLAAAVPVSAVLFVLVTTAGCVSATLPPPLSAAEAQRRSDLRIGGTVGVETYRWHAYSDSLLAALRGSNLFASVKPLDQFATPPTLIARVEEPYSGGVATIPVWTILSLGIVPTAVRESFGYDFSLRYSADERHPYHVRYVSGSTTTLGWVALFEAMSPDVALGTIQGNDRFLGRLALAIQDALSPPAGGGNKSN